MENIKKEINKIRIENLKLKMFCLINKTIIKVIKENNHKKNSDNINRCVEDILRLMKGGIEK